VRLDSADTMNNQDPADRRSSSVDRQKMEAKLVNRFMTLFSEKMDEMQEREAKSKRNVFRLEPAEKALLTQVNNFGLYEGMAAGVLTLISLRRLRRIVHVRRHGPSTNVTPFSSQASPFNPVVTTPPPPRSRFSFGSIFGWLLDSTASFCVAATVSWMYTDTSKIQSKLTEIPLTPGRSVVSEEFCPLVLRELRQLIAQSDSHDDSELDSTFHHVDMRDIINHPHSPYLRSMITFGVNCQRRITRQEELSLAQDDYATMRRSPPPIPAPGLPPLHDVPAQSAVAWIQQGQSKAQDDMDDYE
jgi:hypothetical protein